MRHTESSREVFASYPIPKALGVMAVPAVVGQLIVLFYNLADTFFIGRTGNPYMVAAASLVLPVFNISVALSNMVGMGGGTLISRLMGAGKDEEARKVSSFSFYLTLFVSLAFSLVMLLGMDGILFLLGASSETIGYARQYAFCVIVLGAVPTIMSMMLANILRSTGHSKEAGFGVSAGGILNIFLDPLFMFVLMPDGMEMVGAGLATMLSNCCSTLYFVSLIVRDKKGTLTFSPRTGLPSKESIASVFLVGVPAGTGNLLFDVSYIVIDKLMSGYGDIPLAAIGIVLKAERLPLNVGVGICQGMTPIVAYNYGAKNYKRMTDTTSFARLCGLVVGAFSILFYELFAGKVMSLFIGDPDTIALGTRFLRVRALATPFMFMCFHMQFFFQGVGRGPRALLIAIVRLLLLNIPMLFVFNAVFGMYGIVWTQLVSDVVSSLFAFYLYTRLKARL